MAEDQENAPADIPSAPAAPAREAIPVRRFLSDTVVYGIGDTFDRAIGLILLPITTSLMGVSGYGLLTMFSAVTEILFYVIALGMLTSFFRHYTEETSPARKCQILSVTFWTITVMAVAVAALIAPLCAFWSSVAFQTPDDWFYVLLMLPWTYTSVLISLGHCRLQADGRAFVFLGVSLTQSLVTRSLALVLLFAGLGAMGWIVGSIIGQTISVVAFIFLAYSGISLRFDKALVGKLVPYGAVLLPTAISTWLMYGVTKILMGWIFTWQGYSAPRDAVGLFGVGERISQIMFIMNLAFVLGWRRFAFNNMHHEQGPRLLGTGVTIFVLISAYAGVGLIALGDDLVRWTMREEFWPGIQVIPYLTLAGFFWGVGEVLNIGMHKAQKTKLLSSLYLIAAILNLFLLWTLVWGLEMGIVGAAVSLMCCELLKMGLLFWSAQRVYRLEIRYRTLLVAACVFLPMLALCYEFFPETTIASSAIQLGLVLVTPILLLGLGLAIPTERAQILDLFGRVRRRLRRDG